MGPAHSAQMRVRLICIRVVGVVVGCYSRLYTMMMSEEEEFTARFDQAQSMIMLFRRIQLSVGATIMFILICSIIRKRLYVFNTTKLFMWFCICYFTGMLVVCFHNDYLNGGVKFFYLEQPDSDHYILNVLNKMKADGSIYWCSLEAFINLYAYDFGYFFAVLVSFNVFSVIRGNYRNFMKGVFSNPKAIVFLIFMLVAYLVPLVQAISTFNFLTDEGYWYSPMGFEYSVVVNGKQRMAMLLFYGGFNAHPDRRWLNYVMHVNMYVCPIVMLVVHTIILVKNKRKIGEFEQQEYLNSRQLFLVKSGKLGTIVFMIQSLHFIKQIIGLILSSFFSNTKDISLIILNFAFDFYPFLVLWFYHRYTRESKGSQYHSSILEQDES